MSTKNMKIAGLVSGLALLAAGCTATPPITPGTTVLRLDGERIYHLVPSPGSKTLAVASDVRGAPVAGEKTRIVSLEDRTVLATIAAPIWGGVPPRFSPDSSKVTLRQHDELRTYDARTGQDLGPAQAERPALDMPGWQVRTTPDSKAAVAFDKHENEPVVEVVGLDLPSKHERFRTTFRDARAIEDVAISPDGSFVVVSGFEEVMTLEFATGKKVASWSLGLWHSASQITFSPDGRLAVGTCHQGHNGEFHVYEVATGSRVATLPRDFSGSVLHFFEDGRRILTRSPDSSLAEPLARFGIEAAYRLFDLETETEIARFEPAQSGDAVVTPDEKRLVWVVEDCAVKTAVIPER